MADLKLVPSGLADAAPVLDPTKCNGKKKQGEGLCQRPAGAGTPHPGVGTCKLHGGCAPNAVKKGERLLLERDARELFGKIAPEISPVENPLQAFAEIAGRVLAWMGLMDELVGDLRRATREDFFGGEQVQPIVELYERSMDRAANVLAMYARLRIDDRLAELQEKQKLTVLRAIEAAMDEIGVQDEARADAKRRVAKHLRLAYSAAG